MATSGCFSRFAGSIRKRFSRSSKEKRSHLHRSSSQSPSPSTTPTLFPEEANNAIVQREPVDTAGAPKPIVPLTSVSSQLHENTSNVNSLALPIIRVQHSIESDATAVVDASLPHPFPFGERSRVRANTSHSNTSSIYERSDSDISGEHKLRDLLRRAEKKCHPLRQNRIVPRSQLEALVTVAVVVEDLRGRHSQIDLPTAHHYAEKACRCAKQWYAILAYLKRGADIMPLLDEGITDADLPLLVTENEEFELTKKDGQAIKAIAGWCEKEREDFDKFQSTINAPVFEQDKHYDFDACTHLPFVRLKECDHIKGKEGGYSYVSPVRIHQGNHKFWPSKSEDEEPLIAVKQLFSKDPKEFTKEQEILLQLGSKDNRHLIKLLATYKKDDTYHLMFPWADGNLRTFWCEHQPSPDFKASTIRWSLEQILGLAQALSLIHNFRPTLPLGAPSIKDLKLPRDMKLDVKPEEQQFGRHGDIKPENILWFMKDGTLKIADFGLGRFHSRDSRSKIDPATLAASLTYEPPEMSLGVQVSRAYDIWSLGCMFLEFITWLLEGAEKIEAFADYRGVLDKSTDIDDDNFYTVSTDCHGKKSAVVRDKMIEWVARLHSNEKCSQFIHELLDLTMSGLLVVESKDRINAQQLVRVLTEMLKKAKDDESFMVEAMVYTARPDPTQQTPQPIPSPPRDQPQGLPKNSHTAHHLIESVNSQVMTVTRDLVGRTSGTPGFWSGPNLSTRSTT